MIRKLLLIQSPIDEGIERMPYAIPPLGIISLATYLHQKVQGLEVMLHDGDMEGLESCMQVLDSHSFDLVGISASSSEAHNNAMAIAAHAKSTGAKVVIGGEQATARAEQILANRPFVDFVVKAQGETPLLYLIVGQPLEEIPSLVYRKRGEICQNSLGKRLSLRNSELPIPDRSLVDIPKYREKFLQTIESRVTGAHGYASTRTQYGCLSAIQHKACTFCSRTDIYGMDARQPHTFWEEMEILLSQDLNYTWEIAPSFTSPPAPYLRRLADAKPLGCTIRLRVYASPKDEELCCEGKVESLARIGVENVLAGFESGDQHCLDLSNKNMTIREHLQSVRNLKKYNLSLCSAFLIGLPGETQESMYKTLEHARCIKELIGEKNFRWVTASIMQPYPGTQVWDECVSRLPEVRALVHEDVLNMDLLSKKYVEEILHLDMGEVASVVQQIRDLAPIGTGKGPIKIKYGSSQEQSY